jgi:hypothetical protein
MRPRGDLDPGAVDQEVERALGPTIGDVHLQGLLAPLGECSIHLPGNGRLSVLKFGTAQSRSISRNRLSTNPVVRLSAMPNRTFIVRHVWISASLQSGCRPRLPVGAASHVMVGSNQPYGD